MIPTELDMPKKPLYFAEYPPSYPSAHIFSLAQVYIEAGKKEMPQAVLGTREITEDRRSVVTLYMGVFPLCSSYHAHIRAL